MKLGFLERPDVRRWLSGVEPAWTILDFGSYSVLQEEPTADNGAIRLDPNLTATDLSESAVARVARMLLERANEPRGLKLTATGNLSQAVIAKMVEIVEWPGIDRDELFALHKVINEPDFLPVHFVRVLLQESKLVRKQRDKLVPTRLGTSLLTPKRYGALHALLFHIAFWHLNLGYFDRNPIDSWPQRDVGVVLWSLSASANDWLAPETLTRLCTVPVTGVIASERLMASYAMEARILRPLVWFGLLKQRSEKGIGLIDRHLYRKTLLFDRFVKFAVQIERQDTRH